MHDFLEEDRVLQRIHLVVMTLLGCLLLTGCTHAGAEMAFPIKEAAIGADDANVYWLDNTRVLFKGYTGREEVTEGQRKRVNLLNHGYYVWDTEQGSVTKDPRFEHAAPECINGQTQSYVVRYSPDGKSSKRRMFLGEEEVPLPEGVWINPISCRPALTQPPPWVVNRHTSTSKVPLLDEHGYIDRGVDGEDRQKNFPLLFYRPGAKEGIPLGLGSQQVDPGITYYPFVDAYLLQGQRSTPRVPPFWLLRPDGTLEQIFSPQGKSWAQQDWANFHLTRRGLFLVSKRFLGDGDLGEAGGYLLQGENPIRIMLGVLQWVAVSPDGCKLAVVNNRYERHIPIAERFKLQMIDVCQGDHHAD